MIVDFFSKLFSGFQKMLSSFFNSPMITFGSIGIVCFLIVGYILVSATKPAKRVYQLSETERLCEIHEVIETLPNLLRCENDKKFVRNNLAFNMREGWRNVTMWLGKRGTAYTFKLESTEPSKYKKIGMMYEGLKAIISEESINKLPPEDIEKIRRSDIYVTVELEAGMTPDKLPKMSEQDVYSEVNQNMANLIGSRIRSALHREDWIRNGGLVALGVALTFIANALGIIKV